MKEKFDFSRTLNSRLFLNFSDSVADWSNISHSGKFKCHIIIISTNNICDNL